MDLLQTWTREDLETHAEYDVPEGRVENLMFVAVSPKLLLSLMDFCEQGGTRIEMVSAHGVERHVSLRFFRRDV